MPSILRSVFFIAWLLWCTFRVLPEPSAPSPEGRVALSGVVSDVRCSSLDRCRLKLEEVRLDGHDISAPLTLISDGDSRGTIQPGDTIELEAFVRAERLNTNPGMSAFWTPDRVRWRAWQIPTSMVRVVSSEPRWRLSDDPLDILNLEARALYRAMLLGQKGELPLETREAFANTGTAHLLAISGLHLAVLGWGFYRLLLILLVSSGSWAQSRRLPAYAAFGALCGVWSYVLAIQTSAATYRAALLLSLLFIGALISRSMSALRALMLTGFTLITLEPSLALGASFQLSFAAVGALVLAAPLFQTIDAWLMEPGRLEGPLWPRVARWLARATLASLVTTLATSPLTLAWFGQFSPWGVLFNLVAVPLTSLLVVPFGLLWYLSAHLSPTLAASLSFIPEHLASTLLELVTQWSTWTGSAHSAAWPHALGLACSLGLLYLLYNWRLGWLLLIPLLAGILTHHDPLGAELRVSVLDVAHGDAAVVEGPDGRVALVDTGGSVHQGSNSYLASRTILPALARLGHERLDALILTHADLDHMGAAHAIVDRLEVAELWLSPCSLEDPRVLALWRKVDARGGRIRLLLAGERVSWGALTWHVLWPERPEQCLWGSNESGLALRLDFASRRLLFVADIGHPAEAALLDTPDALQADVLKVGHHGSRGSSSLAFIDAVKPSHALVSGRFVGGRMPPHQEVLASFCRRGIALGVTGREGALQVRVGPEGDMEVGGLRPP